MMLYISGVISLLIQLIVGLIDFWGLTINVPEDKNIFKDLLKLELGVQIVEFTFYAWMVFNFKNITNITPYRYFDWFLTTPTMLITLMAFLSKNNFNNLSDFIKSNKKAFEKYFDIKIEESEKEDINAIIDKIGLKKSYLLKGGVVDENRVYQKIIKDWQEGNLRM